MNGLRILTIVPVAMLLVLGCSEEIREPAGDEVPVAKADAPTQCSATEETKIAHGRGGIEVHRSPGKTTFYSPTYTIDKVYRSMQGPGSMHPVPILDLKKPELLWITGAEVEMVGPDKSEPRAAGFMCHANLDINSDVYEERMGTEKGLDGRMFTLSQGQLRVMFPKGFGIPIYSDQPIEFTTQVLNLNLPKPKNLKVRHKVTVHFVRDSVRREKRMTMTPLFESGCSAMVSLSGRKMAWGIPDSLKDEFGNCISCCIPGKAANHHDIDKDEFGQSFSGHWIVPPGKQVSRTRVTTLIDLPYDTTCHCIAVHLHPFAESLELRDVTADKTIFKSKARNFLQGIGLDHVDSFHSIEGVELFKDHEYELVTTYNNTSKVDQDSMAVMYLYLRDKDLEAPDGKPRPPALGMRHERPILIADR